MKRNRKKKRVKVNEKKREEMFNYDLYESYYFVFLLQIKTRNVLCNSTFIMYTYVSSVCSALQLSLQKFFGVHLRRRLALI